MKFSLGNLFIVGALALNLYGQPVQAQAAESPAVDNCRVIAERYVNRFPGPLSPEPALPQVFLETFHVAVPDGANSCFYDFKINSSFIRSYRHTGLNCGVDKYAITCTGFAFGPLIMDVFALDYPYNAKTLLYPVEDWVFGVYTLWFHLGNPLFIPSVMKG